MASAGESSSAPYTDMLSGEDPSRTTDQPHVHFSGSTHGSNYVSMELGTMPKNVDDDDDEEVNYDMDASIVSSVLTADGIHDMQGFLCVCMVILIGDMSRGVMFPSMWPLVESLGGTQVTLGYSVAAFSFGRVLVNPLFGSWSITYGYTKTLICSCTILLFGTLVYAQVQNVGRSEFLIVAQTLLGIGSGTLGVTRAFVADVTAKRHRTTYMAWITAVQYAGFTATPIIGALFNKILVDKDYQWFIFRFNMFTAPAYFMALIVSLTLGLLLKYFQNRQRIQIKKEAKKSHKRAAIDEYASTTTFIGLTIYDCCILGCFLLNISTKGSIASFETLGIAIAQDEFELQSARAGAIVGTCGIIGVAALLSMGHLTQLFTDIQLITGGLVVMGMGILSLTHLQEANNQTWRYVSAMFMIYSVGYPIGHTAVIGIFSKIIGRRPQGTLLGWFASAGSLARMFFPIMSGYISKYRGIATLFYVLTVVLALSTVFTLLSRKTLTLLSS